MTIARFLVLLAFALVARAQSFKSIDYPGAASTSAWGVNSHGEIVGNYTNSDTTAHGFLLQGGVFKPLDAVGLSENQRVRLSFQPIEANDVGALLQEVQVF